MDLRSSTRSSRSRSKTPLSLITERENLRENHIEFEQNVSRITRRTNTTVLKTGNGSSTTFDSIKEEMHQVKPSNTKRITRSSKFHKTSDYSSEEGENEVTSTRQYLSDNDKNRLIEDSQRASADTSASNTAFRLYRKAKNYWDEYPKTDWTYSPFSKDRVELAPGVVAMPNMSRRHISTYNKYISTSTQASLRPTKLFAEDGESSENKTFISYMKKILFNIVFVFVGIFYLSWSSVMYVCKSSHSLAIRLAKIIHRFTSLVMLNDTWLLRKTSNGGKIKSILILCLVPLGLLAGWWILSVSGNGIFEYIFSSSIKTSQHSEIWNELPGNGDSNTYNLKDEDLKRIAKYLEEKNHPRNENEFRMNENQDNIVQDKLNELQNIINELTTELNQMKIELSNVQNREVNIDQFKSQIHEENIRKIDNLVFQLNRCCRKSLNLESHVFKILTSSLNNPDFLQNQEGLKNWLQSFFVAKNEFEGSLANITEKLGHNFEKTLEMNSKFLMDKVTERINLDMKYKVVNGDDFNSSDEKIKKIVHDILKIYDADKTGLVDYAMESMGGEIVTTRCTETYHMGTGVVTVLGYPLWNSPVTPRTVITPGTNPGQCWAFQNFPGLLVVKLMAPTKIEAFSLEHVSRLLVPNGTIDSAPRDFEVYGLEGKDDKNGVKIGEYRYDYDGDSLQFFIAQKPDQVFEYIELRIISNHGNPNYTCLYRFRVHGKRVGK